MTVLMPSWYYEKKDLRRSPSVAHGINVERESRYRREGARFIINVGTKMGLRYDTMATGVIYFHRFYMFHSFKTFPRYVTACCCLFLAGKVEETPKKCKDIIRIAKSFLADSQFTQFGDDPKEEVMTLERILLQTIKFDLQVDHPYGHLLKYAKSLKGDKVKLQNMVQMAWTFINDSLCTTLCLQFEPEVIAIALMYLAGKLSKFEVVDWIGRTTKHSHWWEIFVEGMSIELLEDICHQVLDLYSTPMSDTPQDSPPATPPTKSTRKTTSQPPSPIEAVTSPAQIKPKEIPVVGQPIPRLEPGELKRKVTQSASKKETESSAPKVPRITEGKAIPTIIHTSPLKGNSNNSHGSNTHPSSPTSPIPVLETSSSKPVRKHQDPPIQRSSSSDAVYKTSSGPTYPSAPTILPADKAVPVATTFQATVPPPAATYTQPTPSFYSAVAHEATQPYPNVQQPPPQIYPPHSLQFQHPPPPVAPSAPLASRLTSQYGEPSHQYPPLPPPSGGPPFNTQFPPPPRHPAPPPSLISNPPPSSPITQHMPPGISHRPPRPQGLPPSPGILRLPGRPSLLGNEGPYGPRNMFTPPPPHPDRGGRMLPHLHYDNNPQGFRGHRDSEGAYPPYPEENFHRLPHPNQFGHSPRRFPMDHQPQHRRAGPRPPPMGNPPPPPQQQGASTGIAPVRITGS